MAIFDAPPPEPHRPFRIQAQWGLYRPISENIDATSLVGGDFWYRAHDKTRFLVGAGVQGWKNQNRGVNYSELTLTLQALYTLDFWSPNLGLGFRLGRTQRNLEYSKPPLGQTEKSFSRSAYGYSPFVQYNLAMGSQKFFVVPETGIWIMDEKSTFILTLGVQFRF